VAADPLAGLDVLVSVRVDADRVAAVWRGEWGAEASSYAGSEAVEHGVGWCTLLGTNPAVLAGRLPPGAVAASVRDAGGVRHEGVTGRGYWLCVLPGRVLQEEPAVHYRDGEANSFVLTIDVSDRPGFELGGDLADVLRRATVPALWPKQSGVSPVLRGWGGGPDSEIDHVSLDGGEWEVVVSANGVMAPDEFQGEIASLPGSILGQPHAFGLVSTRNGWAALAECGTFAVCVEAAGELPRRLDLVRVLNAPAGA
jgi:hypothetical protein